MQQGEPAAFSGVYQSLKFYWEELCQYTKL